MNILQKGGRFRPLIFPFTLISLSTLIAYWGVWRFALINYDDNKYMTLLPHLKPWTANVAWAFKATTFANWYPLTWISYLVDCALFWNHFGFYHVTNLVIHIAACCVLFIFLRELTLDSARSLIVTMLFAVHPLHIQSVAWIAERKDCLSGLFLALTLLAYLRHARGGRGYYVLTLIFFAAGLMSKSMLVTVPPLLMLLDFYILKRFNLWEKLPMFGMSISAGIMAIYAQRSWGATVTHIPFSMGFANALLSYVKYLVKLCWPSRLSIFYPFPTHIPWQLSIGAAAFLAIASILILEKGEDFIKFGWTWFLLTLIPVVGFMKVGLQGYADRYMYIPSIGCFMIAAWAVKDRRLLIPLGILTIAVCIIVDRRNIYFWKDSISIWTHALQITGDPI